MSQRSGRYIELVCWELLVLSLLVLLGASSVADARAVRMHGSTSVGRVGNWNGLHANTPWGADSRYDPWMGFGWRGSDGATLTAWIETRNLALCEVDVGVATPVGFSGRGQMALNWGAERLLVQRGKPVAILGAVSTGISLVDENVLGGLHWSPRPYFSSNSGFGAGAPPQGSILTSVGGYVAAPSFELTSVIRVPANSTYDNWREAQPVGDGRSHRTPSMDVATSNRFAVVASPKSGGEAWDGSLYSGSWEVTGTMWTPGVYGSQTFHATMTTAQLLDIRFEGGAPIPTVVVPSDPNLVDINSRAPKQQYWDEDKQWHFYDVGKNKPAAGGTVGYMGVTDDAEIVARLGAAELPDVSEVPTVGESEESDTSSKIVTETADPSVDSTLPPSAQGSVWQKWFQDKLNGFVGPLQGLLWPVRLFNDFLGAE